MDSGFFKKYTSATLAGGGSQTVFESDGGPVTGRIYNRVYGDGEYDFSFLFANVTDSTFSDGSRSVRNMKIPPWRLISASVAVSDGCEPADGDEAGRTELLFGGSRSKDVGEGEVFCSDPVRLTVRKGQYLSVGITCAGGLMPCHEESVLPVFVKSEEGWRPCVHIPVPAMTGCSRQVKTRVCFWGDSITQGIGAPKNSYLHYSARTAELVGFDGIAYWDLGLGFARADDAATCGVWMEKAKTNDVVSVCFGVNDINKGFSANQLKANIRTIVSELKKAGCRVLLQTVPPYNHSGGKLEIWHEVNRFIREDCSIGADAVFDCAAALGDPEMPQKAVYGGHPNAEGCRIWAEGLAPVLKKLI